MQVRCVFFLSIHLSSYNNTPTHTHTPTDTANHAHEQLSRLLLGYSQYCKDDDDRRKEFNRWVKRATTLWSTIDDRNKNQRVGKIYSDLLRNN